MSLRSIKPRGATREKLFEAFIKTGGEKEQFIKVVQLEKSVEQINQLETEGGFYTEKEMKDVLKFTVNELEQHMEEILQVLNKVVS
ncbi:unnamed protein product, partial [Durusdinium trenchii]